MAKMKKSRTGASSALNNVLMQMRKVANHPDLLTSQYDDSLEYPPPDVLVEQCGKMALMHRLLLNLKANGHKVLIFSQMTKMLDLIETYLEQLGHRACRIDGNISWQDRQQAMKDFNTDPGVFAFLLSTRAGGLGERTEGSGGRARASTTPPLLLFPTSPPSLLQASTWSPPTPSSFTTRIGTRTTTCRPWTGATALASKSRSSSSASPPRTRSRAPCCAAPTPRWRWSGWS